MHLFLLIAIFFQSLISALGLPTANLIDKLNLTASEDNLKCQELRNSLLMSKPEILTRCTNLADESKFKIINVRNFESVLCTLYYHNFICLCEISNQLPLSSIVNDSLINEAFQNSKVSDVCPVLGTQIGCEMSSSVQPMLNSLNNNCNSFCDNDEKADSLCSLNAFMMKSYGAFMSLKQSPATSAAMNNTIEGIGNKHILSMAIHSTPNDTSQLKDESNNQENENKQKPNMSLQANDNTANNAGDNNMLTSSISTSGDKSGSVQNNIKVDDTVSKQNNTKEDKQEIDPGDPNTKIKLEPIGGENVNSQENKQKLKIQSEMENTKKIEFSTTKENNVAPPSNSENPEVQSVSKSTLVPQISDGQEKDTTIGKKDDAENSQNQEEKPVESNQGIGDKQTNAMENGEKQEITPDEDDLEYGVEPDIPPKSSEVKQIEQKSENVIEFETSLLANVQNQNIDDSDSYFFSYFMMICVIFICAYVAYHNKQKILALVLEGRRGKRVTRSRRPNSANYRKLDSNLEEAVTSSVNKNTPQVIY